MASSLLKSFSILLCAAQLGLAVPSVSTQTACADIKSATPGKLFVKGDAAYTKENKDWWNSGVADMTPACIAMPSSAEDVSKIVKLLNKHMDVPFAIKSGGHSPNRGQSSVKEGILIALRNIEGVKLDKARGVAYVRPGGHWKSVIKPLDDQGYTVVSGRLGRRSQKRTNHQPVNVHQVSSVLEASWLREVFHSLVPNTEWLQM
jgi:hypothetical protein